MDLMRKQLKRQPELGEIFARSLAAKMWAYSKLSAVNTLYPLLDRYAAYLYRMSAESLEFPIALATSAGLLGAGERQLQRVLRTLAERGVIARAGRTLTIIDVGFEAAGGGSAVASMRASPALTEAERRSYYSDSFDAEAVAQAIERLRTGSGGAGPPRPGSSAFRPCSRAGSIAKAASPGG